MAGTSRKDDHLIVREINLAAMGILYNYTRQDEVFVHCEALLQRHAFFDKDFAFVLGDAAEYTSSYLNSEPVRSHVVRFLLEARNQLRIFRLVVVRVARSLPQWMVQYARATTHAARDALALPFSVVPLHPDAGRLFYVVDKRRGPHGYWAFEPATPETGTNAADYLVYPDADDLFVAPVAVADYQFRDAKLATAVRSTLVLGGSGSSGSNTSRGEYLLHSRFWAGYERKRQLWEIEENILDAEHCMAHPRLVYNKKPPQEYQPETITALNKQLSAGIHEASRREHNEVARLAWQGGMEYMEYMQDTQVRTGADGTAITKRRALRDRNDRPSVNDDAVLLPEHMALAANAEPTYKVDLTVWRTEYEQLMARLFHGMPLADVQGQTHEHGVVNKNESVNAYKRRDEVYHRERLLLGLLWERVYRDTLARLDLHAFDAAMDTFSDAERRAVAEVLVPAAAGKRAAGSARPSKTRIAQTAMARAVGAGVRAAEALTARELRDVIAKRLVTEDYVVCWLRFDADAEYYDFVQPELRVHEHLEPDVRESRIQELKLMKEMFEAGIVAAEDVRKHMVQLLDMKAGAPSDKELKMLYPPPKPPAAGGSKK